MTLAEAVPKTPILPRPEEVPALVPDSSSITWRRAGDARGMLAAGYALMMQVAHPTVGAGVLEHSNYAEDPWGRLFNTLDFLNTMIYGGPDAAAAMGRRVRDMHKQINGVKADGGRYYALEPEAYAWVHATLIDAIVLGNARFGRPLRPDQRERIYEEWRDLGRLIGVRERDLPEGWVAFRDYFDTMVHDRLDNNETVEGVLATLAKPASPPVPMLRGRAWNVARIPVARVFAMATVGLLPPLLRDRCGLSWTRAQENELRALGAVSRAATPLMPKSLLVMGPGYLKWREKSRAKAQLEQAAAV